MNSVSLICIMGSNRVIGHKNAMPWHHRADLKRFKSITMGKPIIMGRLTYESIGKALPGRENIVVTREAQRIKTLENSVKQVDSPASALKVCKEHAEKEIMVIGGAQLYKLFMPSAARIYLTVIDHDYDGDTYFPLLNEHEWDEVKRQDFPADDLHHYPFSFIDLKRRKLN